MFQVLTASLNGLRSRFETAASSYHGTRCSLVRESYAAGDCPISRAMLDDYQGRRDVIGHAADGVSRVVVGFFARCPVCYTVWFVHEALRTATKDSPEVYAASRQASSCEDTFWELAEEAGRLLRDLPSRSCPLLADLLSTSNLTYGWLLWFVAIFEAARRRPPGTVLRTSVSIPRKSTESESIVEVVNAACIPDSLIVNLDCNPFVGSIALIDCILNGVGKSMPEESLTGTPPAIAPQLEDDRTDKDAAGAEKVGNNTVDSEERPVVNMQLCQIRWRGINYDVTVDGATLFNALLEVSGDYIAAGNIVNKPSRVFRGLPGPLQELIKTSNKGYRLRISAQPSDFARNVRASSTDRPGVGQFGAE